MEVGTHISILVTFALTSSPFLASLYRAIYSMVLANPELAELTIEDPSEAFEDLRDKNDLRMLLSHPTFAAEAYGGDDPSGQDKTLVKGKAKLGPPVDKGWAEQWRKDLKLAGVCAFVLDKSKRNDLTTD